jgi:hypothetical protein
VTNIIVSYIKNNVRPLYNVTSVKLRSKKIC